MDAFIKNLIDINKDAEESIENLEKVLQEFSITDEKDKANFGNTCILLQGYRLVAKASECLLINENVIKGRDGEFYQKLDSDSDDTNTEELDLSKIKEENE